MTGYLPRERISAPIMEIDLMNMQVQDSRRGANGGYKVDVTHGEHIGRV